MVFEEIYGTKATKNIPNENSTKVATAYANYLMILKIIEAGELKILSLIEKQLILTLQQTIFYLLKAALLIILEKDNEKPNIS